MNGQHQAELKDRMKLPNRPGPMPAGVCGGTGSAGCRPGAPDPIRGS